MKKTDIKYQELYIKRIDEMKNGIDDMNSFLDAQDAFKYFNDKYLGLWVKNNKMFDFDEKFEVKKLVSQEGLIEAILTWDPNRGCFSTHCTNKMRGSITKHKRQENRLVRVPNAVIDNRKTISKVSEKARARDMHISYDLDTEDDYKF